MSAAAQVVDYLARPRLENRGEASLPEALVPKTLDEAYLVQAELVERLIAKRGGYRIGYKIACSNELAQKLLNVDAPLFGTLMSASTFDAPAILKASDFNVRCIEAEFGFEMAQHVPAGTDAHAIRGFIRSVYPSIELVNHYWRDWTKLGANVLVADNAIHGAWIRGAPCSTWRDIDFSRQAVALKVNGAVKETGSGAAVLGNPLNVLAWLANELPKRGRVLRAGDYVTTGVTTNVYLAQAGDRLEADFGAVGKVELTLS